MIDAIKTKIEASLFRFIDSLNKAYRLKRISPLLFTSIRDYVLRPGKRVRPILFVIGYRGFKNGQPRGLYTSALSLELLHDFMLVHDDIIDKSPLRRGKPAMHTMLDHYLRPFKAVKFNGEDLAIVTGDVMYALGLQAFLSVDVKLTDKERALRKLIDAAIYTGCGEFIELLSGIKEIGRTAKTDIYKIYDFKTACYTFATPLSMGALIAGASDKEGQTLFRYGILLGRAFQIKDDILGTFGSTASIGKSNLTDLKEAKKTVLIWYAYRHAPHKDKVMLKKMLGNDRLGAKDLLRARAIIESSGALLYAQKEISSLLSQAHTLLSRSGMKIKYKQMLSSYAKQIVGV